MSNPITGRETDIDTKQAVGALAEFYLAFNSRSFELMELNWIDSNDASMESPLGGSQGGWPAISKLYGRLFRGKATVTAELHDYSIYCVGETFLAVGYERGRYTRDNIDLKYGIRTSRWFTRVYERYRQFHYHGSIDDANLLARYQSAFFSEPDPNIVTVDSISL